MVDDDKDKRARIHSSIETFFTGLLSINCRLMMTRIRELEYTTVLKQVLLDFRVPLLPERTRSTLKSSFRKLKV